MRNTHKYALIRAVSDYNRLLDRIVLFGDERGLRRKILIKICANREQYKEALKYALWLKHRVTDLLDMDKDAGITEEYRAEYYKNIEYLKDIIHDFDRRLRKKHGLNLRDVPDDPQEFSQGVF